MLFRYGTYMYSFVFGPAATVALFAPNLREGEREKTYVVEQPRPLYEKSITSSIKLGALDRESPMGPLIFLSLVDTPGSHIPFGVFLDTTTKSVVVSIRGTQSLEDTMSDLLAVGEDDDGNVGEFDLTRCVCWSEHDSTWSVSLSLCLSVSLS